MYTSPSFYDIIGCECRYDSWWCNLFHRRNINLYRRIDIPSSTRRTDSIMLVSMVPQSILDSSDFVASNGQKHDECLQEFSGLLFTFSAELFDLALSNRVT